MGKINKVVVCGMKGVGKTSILEQVIYGNITKDTVLGSTIEDTYCTNIETEKGGRERVRFYDTGENLCAHYPIADGFLLVFNPTKPETLDFIMLAKKEIDKQREKKEAVFVVLSNRFGGAADGSVSSRADSWATKEKMRLYEVNAFDRDTLFQSFVWLSSKMTQPQAKSSFPQLAMRKRD